MVVSVSNVTHAIATAHAWKVFAALLAAAGLMLNFLTTNRLGFVCFVVMLFGWLSSVAVELAKANGMLPRTQASVGALGIVSVLAFSFPDYLPLAVPNAVVAFYLPLSGFGLLVCMMYLLICIGSLLEKLEGMAGKKPRTNASLLVWMWPVGIWFLQPRLRQVLRKQSAA
jgi:hypothetical protein